MKTNCTNCNTEFETIHDTKKYCSSNCKQEHFYKRKFNLTNELKADHLRKQTTDSLYNNEPLLSQNSNNQNRPGTQTTNDYLQQYIDAIKINAELQTKLDIAQFTLQHRELQDIDDEEEEEEEETEKDKFYKSLNGILPIALQTLLSKINNGTTQKPL
jgi:hypothetical protein